jgi:hypothetical protein
VCWNLEPKFSMDAYSKTQESKLTFRTPKSVLMNNKKSVEFCVTAVRFGHMSNLRGLCFVSTHFQYFFLTLTDAFWPWPVGLTALKKLESRGCYRLKVTRCGN